MKRVVAVLKTIAIVLQKTYLLSALLDLPVFLVDLLLHPDDHLIFFLQVHEIILHFHLQFSQLLHIHSLLLALFLFFILSLGVAKIIDLTKCFWLFVQRRRLVFLWILRRFFM